MTTKESAPEGAAPRIEAVIDEYMRRFTGPSVRASARFFEEVHQALAPLCRELEAENAALRRGPAADRAARNEATKVGPIALVVRRANGYDVTAGWAVEIGGVGIGFFGIGGTFLDQEPSPKTMAERYAARVNAAMQGGVIAFGCDGKTRGLGQCPSWCGSKDCAAALAAQPASPESAEQVAYAEMDRAINAATPAFPTEQASPPDDAVRLPELPHDEIAKLGLGEEQWIDVEYMLQDYARQALADRRSRAEAVEFDEAAFEVAFFNAARAYSLKVPEGKNFARAIYRAALNARAEPQTAGADELRIDRLRDAIEGECDGLGISVETAREILRYLDTGTAP